MNAIDIPGPIESLLRQPGGAALTGAALYAACISLALVLHRTHSPGSRARLCWLSTACCLMAFGGIEALGLPAKIVDAVRIFSIAQGWYNERGNLQLEFIVAFTGLCGLGLFCLPPLLPSVAGLTGVARALVLLPFFISIRAASLHELDSCFRLSISSCLGINGIIESFILCLILWQLIRAYRMDMPGQHRPIGCHPPES
jgi:hypothetical protein